MNEEQELAARRQAILQQDQLFTEDGQIVDPDAVPVPPPQPVAPPAIHARVDDTAALTRSDGAVAMDGRMLATITVRRGAVITPAIPATTTRYYGGYGYGYRGNYYGTPRFGYYDYPYGGAARVGPMRFYWR